jgi:hypothetical protein
MVLPERSRSRLRGIAYVLVGPLSLGSAGTESVAGDFALVKYLTQWGSLRNRRAGQAQPLAPAVDRE